MFDKLSFSYHTHNIFNNVSFTLPPYSMTAIVGANGAGKSTFLKLLTQELFPQSGNINLSKKSKISYLSQLQNYDKSFPLLVQDVVSMGLIENKNTDLVNKALQVIGLIHLKDQSISTLSGGQFQRMLFARALVFDGDIFLLDEPFSAVDENTIQDLIKCMKDFKHRKTILCVCHDLDLAMNHFDYILHIKNQKIIIYTQSEWNTYFINNGGRLVL